MYSQTTRNIRITVEPQFLEHQSMPEEGRFVWAYRVTLENLSQETVKLLSRYWQITDARGQVQEVRGEGVVGEQPVLKPQENFHYMSGCPLSTPSGVMVGQYIMETDKGESFAVAIPAFSLDSPYDNHRLN